MHANLEYEHPTQYQNQGLNEAPEPTCGGADKALMKIAPHQLVEEISFGNGVSDEVPAGDCGHEKT
jgi:hypothetical protein